jgi:hypothetical protein
MTKKITFLAAAFLALFLVSAPSGAQYGEDFTATIDDVTVVAGQDVVIEGTTVLSETVEITIDDEPVSRAIVPLGTIPVNADDTFSGTVTIPDLAPGTYSMYAQSGDAVLTIDVEVVAAQTPGTTPTTSGGGGETLARTGSATDTLAKVGGGLVLAGAAATLLSSNRRRATA